MTRRFRIAHWLSLEIKRDLDAGDILRASHAATSGVILEFVGCKGGGKSQLFNGSIAKRHDRWFFRHHLTLLNGFDGLDDSIAEAHCQILSGRLTHIDRTESHVLRRATGVEQSAHVIRESLRLASGPFPRGFALDEGLFKNFPDEILSLDDRLAAPLWCNRAFIYLRPRDPVTAVQRYQGRVERRRKQGILQPLEADDQVGSLVRSEIERNDRLIDEARLRERPVLVLVAEDPFDSNVRRVLEFESVLTNGN